MKLSRVLKIFLELDAIGGKVSSFVGRPRILVDECLPPSVATRLYKSGRFARHVNECLRHGVSDNQVRKFVESGNWILLTRDAGFPEPSSGRVLFVHSTNPEESLERVKAAGL